MSLFTCNMAKQLCPWGSEFYNENQYIFCWEILYPPPPPTPSPQTSTPTPSPVPLYPTPLTSFQTVWDPYRIPLVILPPDLFTYTVSPMLQSSPSGPHPPSPLPLQWVLWTIVLLVQRVPYTSPSPPEGSIHQSHTPAAVQRVACILCTSHHLPNDHMNQSCHTSGTWETILAYLGVPQARSPVRL
jgi:hypothetical protein